MPLRYDAAADLLDMYFDGIALLVVEKGAVTNHPDVALNIADVKPSQAKKAFCPILITPSPMVTEVKPVQLLNALLPMLVTLSGMVTDIKPLQPLKASSPMLVTPFPMVTDVKPLQPSKA